MSLYLFTSANPPFSLLTLGLFGRFRKMPSVCLFNSANINSERILKRAAPAGSIFLDDRYDKYEFGKQKIQGACFSLLTCHDDEYDDLSPLRSYT